MSCSILYHTECSAMLNIVVLYVLQTTCTAAFHACYPTARRFRIKVSGPPQSVMDRPTTGRSSVGGVSSAEEPLRDPYERQKPRASEDTSVDRKGRNDGTLRGSNSQQQLLQDLHPVVLLEKNRRIQAEQQVEAQKQVSLELARLLELERQKSKRQARVSTASAGPILRRGSQSSVISTQSVGSILKRRDSQSSGIRKVSQGSWSELENGIEDKIVEEEEEEAEKVYTKLCSCLCDNTPG